MLDSNEMHHLKPQMDSWFAELHQIDFLKDDPIQIPHMVSSKPDKEIIGLLVALMAWGNRQYIIRSSVRLLEIMKGEPRKFLEWSGQAQWNALKGFVHRTIKAEDIHFILSGLSKWYKNNDSLENLFLINKEENDTAAAIMRFRQYIMTENPNYRTGKHIANTSKNSAAKRINMYLRWMVRPGPVDLGIWTNIHMSKLSIPLDVHSGRTARKLGLLDRAIDDLKAVRELDLSLRTMDSDDPVKYDYVLFGLGVNHKL